MTESPAFYARPGSRIGDLITLLHPPYTMWHLGYVAIGASLAPAVDWARLGGTLVTFFLALGVAAHALDEYHDRPLGTSFMDRTLIGMAATALGLGAVLVAAGVAVVDSPLILLWAGVGPRPGRGVSPGATAVSPYRSRLCARLGRVSGPRLVLGADRQVLVVGDGDGRSGGAAGGCATRPFYGRPVGCGGAPTGSTCWSMACGGSRSVCSPPGNGRCDG